MKVSLPNPVKLSEPILTVQGGAKLGGEVSVPGAKNAALPLLVAASLSRHDVVLHNVPTGLNDVALLMALLRDLGVSVREEGTTLVLNGEAWTNTLLDAEQVGRLRHSLLLLGGAAHRRNEIFLPMPGGCNLGSRKSDLHVLALAALGLDVSEEEGIRLEYSAPPRDAEVSFHYPSFGATLNFLFAATGQAGTHVLHNAARNPEVLDVIDLLQKMGARITWQDSATLQVVGGTTLSGTEHTVIADRIVASTLIAATAVTQGRTFLRHASTAVLEAEIAVWQQAGLGLRGTSEGIEVSTQGRLDAVSITTRAYPGFHTDIQPLHAAMMVYARGESTITETILDGRFRYAEELNKMGAATEVREGNFICVNGTPGQILQIRGKERLQGAEVKATDIRGGAAVVVAALGAEGDTEIGNLYQLERGYANLGSLLDALGAQVTRRA